MSETRSVSHGTTPPDGRIVAALTPNGRIVLVEEPVPQLTAGMVRVEVHASLVSPGTELGGWRGLKRRMESGGDGSEPQKFGYAGAGTVAGVGEGVDGFRLGDRVACMGAGYALHTDIAVVPQHLCAALPSNVSFAQGAYAHLAATALQALRRGKTAIGEHVAVAGLGIVGQLAARLHQLAGCFVIGWDTIPFRVETAKRWGIDEAVVAGTEEEIRRTRRFTNDDGLDIAVIAFGGSADVVVDSLLECMKCSPDGHRMGKIVNVGGATFAFPEGTTNVDVIRSSRTGPGYHDEKWEHGEGYPPVFVRWDTRKNLDLVLRFMAEGKLDVDVLTTHVMKIEAAGRAISELLGNPDDLLGVVFEYR